MIVVAAVSARALAEAAAADGLPVLALDLFGDLDTRRAARAWQPIGADEGLAIDGARLLAALHEAPDASAWVAGAGLEGQPELLAQAQALRPGLGTAAADVRSLRDPPSFFRFLDDQAIAHPAVRFDPPPMPTGWLRKNSRSCGGWDLRRAAPHDEDLGPEPGIYWQRERQGLPMSATLLCNGREARVLGFNRQLVQALGDRPYVFAGVLGPVPVASQVATEVQRAARALAERFRVRGLASLDFLLVDGRPEVLELNPRPPASLSLYPRIGAAGPFTAHLRACLHAELPAAADDGLVRGERIVFATSRFMLTPRHAAMLADRPDVRDVPAAGTPLEAGHPVCTLVAQDRDAQTLEARLQSMHDRLLTTLSQHLALEEPQETLP